MKVSDRRMIKQMRQEYGKFYQKSSRRLLETSERLEHFHSYLFTSIVKLDSTTINWFDFLKSQIEFQQDQPIWMSMDRSREKEFLTSEGYFLSTNYPEEISSNYLHRVASDPLMFRKEKSYSAHTSYQNEEEDDLSMQTSTMSLPNRSHSVIEVPSTDQSSFLLPQQVCRADKYATKVSTVDSPQRK